MTSPAPPRTPPASLRPAPGAAAPSPRRRPRAAALLALALAAGCGRAKEPPPPPPPPPSASPLLLAVEGRRVARESLEALAAAQRGMTKVVAVALRASAAVWQASHASCPSADDLVASGHPTAEHASPSDAWERPFRITCQGDDTEVRSAGPDGVFSTDDDVVASDRE
ncbi:MAG TPA: hypothetical protein VFS00_15240 [Polyangiaceae bacterium]|nr:hypothetical protein [Polyangiaceae bacterium]